MIRHILLIKFKPEAAECDIAKLKFLFETMPNKIKGVTAVEWGINDSPENKNQGYTHSVLMTFANDEARERYLPHPEHDALKVVFRPLLEDIVVFDYQC
ncbi:Dabb family protein [Vibrio sp. SCSIO 43136]|uniref:Dabb family protein n=1 Tax=Vibrio sp. SCSIO 43136 TaxID=2819101 RepID=UPI002074F391|nr:Dabb family protein [Vibrio sp. SCSIO 43136]USD67990.1 Dabb family protein [Vibrio sp. SCSIO 43136]